VRRIVTVRLVELVIVFFGVTFIIYAMVFALPGDPIRAMAGERPLSETVIANLRARYNLDDPFLVQYFRYIGGLFVGDFGTNFSGRPVGEQLARAWPVTLTLALSAWVIEIVVGLPIALSGRETASTGDARLFARELAAVQPAPVRMVDERLSTVSANSALRASGRNAKNSRSVVDQVAAVIILQHALDFERSAQTLPGIVVDPHEGS